MGRPLAVAGPFFFRQTPVQVTSKHRILLPKRIHLAIDMFRFIGNLAVFINHTGMANEAPGQIVRLMSSRWIAMTSAAGSGSRVGPFWRGIDAFHFIGRVNKGIL